MIGGVWFMSQSVCCIKVYVSMCNVAERLWSDMVRLLMLYGCKWSNSWAALIGSSLELICECCQCVMLLRCLWLLIDYFPAATGTFRFMWDIKRLIMCEYELFCAGMCGRQQRKKETRRGRRPRRGRGHRRLRSQRTLVMQSPTQKMMCSSSDLWRI